MTKYEYFDKYTQPIPLPVRKIIGREKEVNSILAALKRPEVSNVMLLGPAGSGKTSIVSELSRIDKRKYFEVNLSAMAVGDGATDGSKEMGHRMKQVIEDVIRYQRDTKDAVVLFIDEFHQLARLSGSAIDAIKPILAESGKRDIRIIAATTYDEYVEFIQSDQALDDRLQRISVVPPNKATIISILKDMVKTHVGTPVDDSVYEYIVDYSERYMPSRFQPRKSILILDSMIGWHKAFFEVPIDKKLLDKVIYENTRINANWNMNVPTIRNYLYDRIIDQSFAIESILKRLHISLANIGDDTKPQGTFLFTGSTGVGKTEMAKALATCIFGSEKALIRFDMSEYVHLDSVDLFREQLTDKVWQNPYAIILLDEIEKAHSAVRTLLLQVLDDARLSNRFGREVTFVNSYILLTTNEASEVYKSVAQYDTSTVNDGLKDYNKVIRKSLIDGGKFAPELLNRLDRFIPFKPLTEDSYRRIAKKRLGELQDVVKRKHNINVYYDDEVVRYLTKEHLDTSTDAGGGRGIKRRIDDEITAKIAYFLNTFPNEKNIAINIKGDMSADNKLDRIGTASIVVGTFAGIKKGVNDYA